MKSCLLVFDPPKQEIAYSKFLGKVDEHAKKLEGIECISINVYMIPKNKFLSFVSGIGILLSVYESQGSASYQYKCLFFEEPLEWLHFGDLP